MKETIFIPDKINVGFQKRDGTYTGKLAYIIYFDQKGVLRKENSWNSWRDKNIDNVIHDNSPTSGFVLNKKVGDYVSDWNHRQAYVRVYDPRDFEFEITIENLLYILENTSSIKGKGLEGDFIYGWDGKDLILIPTESPDYKEIAKFNEIIHANNYIKAKDLIIGTTYKFKDNRSLIYMGKFQQSNKEDKETNSFFFYSENKWSGFEVFKSISGMIIDLVDDKCVDNYAELMDELIASSYYSERDQKKDKYVPFTSEQFKEHLQDCYYEEHFYNENGKKYFITKYRNYWYSYQNYIPKYDIYNCERNRRDECIDREISIERAFEKYKPCYLITYKSNSDVIKEWRRTKNEH